DLLRVATVREPPEIAPAARRSMGDSAAEGGAPDIRRLRDAIDAVTLADPVVPDVVGEGHQHRPRHARDEDQQAAPAATARQLGDADGEEWKQPGQEPRREREASIPLAPERMDAEERDRREPERAQE